MKNLLFCIVLVIAAFTDLNAQTVLEGEITSNMTLSNPCYLLRGCVYVRNGAILTIDPGTVIYGESATKGALIIERGGTINADGWPSTLLAPDPIIFTSDKPAGSRAPGDWGGIIIAGYGVNNVSGGTFTVEGPCTPVIAGGNDCNDNSGIFRYVQIHYAGVNVGASGSGNEINSLTLAAVGSGTTIDHIQVSYANDDAFEWFGGCVNTKYLISYNTRDDDFDTDFGFTGKSQFGFALRQDPNQHDVSLSNGIESDNNNVTPNFAGTPETNPIFSNYTLFGPLYCNSAPVHAEFGSGAHIRRNSSHSVYNSVITGWPDFGLLVDGATTMTNTTNDELNFSYNTLANNGTDYSNTPAWSGCAASITAWLGLGGIPASCSEAGNQVLSPAGVTGYSATICNNGCTSTPGFTLGGTNMDAPDYTSDDLNDPFFDATPDYRGAFGTTDWTAGWTEWCPQNADYACEGAGRAASGTDAGALQLTPNPSNGTTYAVFNAEATGKVRISILDKVTGKVLQVVNAEVINKGEQRIAFSASGLQQGVYTVKVETAEGVLAQQLMVK